METDQVQDVTINDTSDQIVESDVPMVIEETEAPEHVNVGYQNWLALRQEWKRRPDGWQPAKRKPIDADQTYEELSTHGQFSQKIPLPELVKLIVEMWEYDGVN
eukprot:TRINITY_DN6683_c0_g1_i1.p1 TRINITY_DN6683_c0_g1~~TRINITY_DN6683_c0_g1_i1.p1  ORF type:complete len:104 (+),score=23.02 TRINITY_DN6683_c0_g1_i1:99-410(+)